MHVNIGTSSGKATLRGKPEFWKTIVGLMTETQLLGEIDWVAANLIESFISGDRMKEEKKSPTMGLHHYNNHVIFFLKGMSLTSYKVMGWT